MRELGKTVVGFGVIFVLGFVGLYLAKLDVYRRKDQILASRARIAQAEAELTGKDSKVWYFTEDFKEYRKKKELEAKREA